MSILPCWGLGPPESFSWREWEGEVVVFVPATGDTHGLSHVASAVVLAMLALRGESREAGFWFRAAIGETDEPEESFTQPAEAEAFEELLQSLVHIGIARRHAS